MPRYDNFFGKYLFGNHLVAKILSYACRILSSLAFSIDSAKAVRTNLKKRGVPEDWEIGIIRKRKSNVHPPTDQGSSQRILEYSISSLLYMNLLTVNTNS